MLKWFPLFALITFASGSWAEEIYVHSAKAQMKAEANMGSPEVAALKRGDALTLIKEEGMWYKVKFSGKEGYISKLFAKKQKPIGQADLFKEAAVSEEKTSRKRTSSYAVSGATRGLTANDRVRGQREQYRSDYQALEDLEKFEISPKTLQSFKKQGGLQ